MRVILQREVANLGKVGDQVTVRRGFGRNYLLPQGVALLATGKNIAEFETRRAALEKAAAEVLSAAKIRAEKLAEMEVVIEAPAGEEGKLFGSVGPRDIAEWVSKAGASKGITLEKKEVSMPEGPIRQVGEYTVQLKLHSAVSISLKIKVVAQTHT